MCSDYQDFIEEFYQSLSNIQQHLATSSNISVHKHSRSIRSTHMKRFDYDRYHKKYSFRYAILDRYNGVSTKIATVYDPADAELICDALNEKHSRELNHEHHRQI